MKLQRSRRWAMAVAVALVGVTGTLADIEPAAAAAAPTITVQPVDQVVANGASATFTSAATGDPTPTVRWDKSSDGGATWIPTSTTTTTFKVTTAASIGLRYRAVYTNSEGTAVTDTVRVVIATAPTVATAPSATTVTLGEQASFTATWASANPAATIAWQRASPTGSFVTIAGATSSTYTFTPAWNQNGYRYRAAFTNVAGTTTTAAATLTVVIPPTAPAISKQPASLALADGQSGTLTAKAWGNPAPSMLWQRSIGGGPWEDLGSPNPPWSGVIEMANDLPIAMSPNQDGWTYRVKAENSEGVAYSNEVTTSLAFPPAITAPPADVTVAGGSTATFSVEVSGTGPFTYAWRKYSARTKNESNAGVTTPTLTTAALDASNDGDRYWVTVTSPFGTVTSSQTTLRVRQAPSLGSQTRSPSSAPSTSPITIFNSYDAAPAPTITWEELVGGIWQPASVTPTLSSTTNGRWVSSFTLPAPNPPGTRTFRSTATNDVGSTTAPPITWTSYTAPVVTSDPTSVTTTAGQTVTFTVAGVGYTSVSWRRSPVSGPSVAIPGATSTTLTVTADASNAFSEYFAVLTNSDGTATSTSARLVVTDVAPQLASSPDGDALDGAPAPGGYLCDVMNYPACPLPRTTTFSAVAYGATDATWQRSADGGATWHAVGPASVGTPSESGRLVTGYTTPTMQPADHLSQYRAVFTNAYGTIVSDPATLTVRHPPQQLTAPASVSVTEGATATFSAAVGSAYPTASIRWQTSVPRSDEWEDYRIDGQTVTTPTLTVTGATLAMDGQRFRLLASNVMGSATSAPATLTVTPAIQAPVPDPTVQPAPLAEGTPVVLRFSATGTPAPTGVFQASPDGITWFDVEDATVTTVGDRTELAVDIEAPLEADGWRARAIWSNAGGSITADEIVLSVGRPPTAEAPEEPAPAPEGQALTLSFSGHGWPAPTAVLQASPDGETWIDVSDADLVVSGDRTTVSIGLTLPIDADGWKARAVFTNAFGTVTTTPVTIHITAG